MRPFAATICLFLLGSAVPALAGGPVILAPPSINIQPRLPVLDQKCVDRLKGSGASAARAAHECRKAASPGGPQPLAAREQGQAAAATSATTTPSSKP